MGRFADRGRPGRAVGIGLVVGIAGWATFAVAGRSLAGLVVGVIVLDLGMQATHVPNQAIVFALDEQARGRLNAAYMVTCFLGAALGSALGAQAWARGGWNAVTATGSALLLVAVGVRALAGRGMGAARATVSPGR
jgi:predicted MFS family arabinose efflux permease